MSWPLSEGFSYSLFYLFSPIHLPGFLLHRLFSVFVQINAIAFFILEQVYILNSALILKPMELVVIVGCPGENPRRWHIMFPPHLSEQGSQPAALSSIHCGAQSYEPSCTGSASIYLPCHLRSWSSKCCRVAVSYLSTRIYYTKKCSTGK